MSQAAVLECAICLQPVETEGEHAPAALPCGHCLGWHCINKYLTTAAKRCPLCQRPCKANSLRKLFLPAVVTSPAEESTALATLKRQLEEKEEELRELRKKIRSSSKLNIVNRKYELRAKFGKCLDSDGTDSVIYAVDNGIYVLDVRRMTSNCIVKDIGDIIFYNEDLVVGSERIFLPEENMKIEIPCAPVKYFSFISDDYRIFLSSNGKIHKMDRNFSFTQLDFPTNLPITTVVEADELHNLCFTFKETFLYTAGEFTKKSYHPHVISSTVLVSDAPLFVTSHRGDHSPPYLLVSRLNEDLNIQVLARLDGHTLPFATCRPAAIHINDRDIFVAATDKVGAVAFWRVPVGENKIPIRVESKCFISGRPEDEAITALEFLETSQGELLLATVSPNFLAIDVVSC